MLHNKMIRCIKMTWYLFIRHSIQENNNMIKIIMTCYLEISKRAHKFIHKLKK